MEYVLGKTHDYTLIWIGGDQGALDDARRCGFRAYHKNSVHGAWYSLQAGVQFVVSGFRDVNRGLALGAKVVTFWHGTPMKLLGVDYFENKRPNLLGHIRSIGYRVLNRHLFMYYASNAVEAKLVGSALGLSSSKVAVLGAPRYDRIKGGAFRSLLPSALQDARVLVFAPTWRAHGFSSEYTLDDRTSRMLESVLLDHNYVLVIKRHPLTPRSECENWNLPGGEGRVFDAEDIGANDINLMYGDADMLISDISSALFDASFVDCKTIMFMPDIEDYLVEHDLYPYIRCLASDNAIRSWKVLIGVLDGSVPNASVELASICNQEAKIGEVCPVIFDDLCTRIHSR